MPLEGHIPQLGQQSVYLDHIGRPRWRSEAIVQELARQLGEERTECAHSSAMGRLEASATRSNQKYRTWVAACAGWQTGTSRGRRGCWRHCWRRGRRARRGGLGASERERRSCWRDGATSASSFWPASSSSSGTTSRVLTHHVIIMHDSAAVLLSRSDPCPA